MKRMVPVESVVVVRDGKRVTPPLGKSYPFTDQEIEDIERVRPEAIRAPVNESGDGDEVLDLPEDGNDAEIEEANEVAAEEQRQEKVARKVARAAGVKRRDVAPPAKAKAAAKVDDL